MNFYRFYNFFAFFFLAITKTAIRTAAAASMPDQAASGVVSPVFTPAVAFAEVLALSVEAAAGFLLSLSVSGFVSGCVSGSVSRFVSSCVSGSVSGFVSGYVSGSVSGFVSGSVSGSVTMIVPLITGVDGFSTWIASVPSGFLF